MQKWCWLQTAVSQSQQKDCVDHEQQCFTANKKNVWITNSSVLKPAKNCVDYEQQCPTIKYGHRHDAVPVPEDTNLLSTKKGVVISGSWIQGHGFKVMD